jgi:hypothetical protein
MVALTAGTMRRAPVRTRFGNLPAADAELNGDYLQVLVRLASMTGDRRFLDMGPVDRRRLRRGDTAKQPWRPQL